MLTQLLSTPLRTVPYRSTPCTSCVFQSLYNLVHTRHHARYQSTAAAETTTETSDALPNTVDPPAAHTRPPRTYRSYRAKPTVDKTHGYNTEFKSVLNAPFTNQIKRQTENAPLTLGGKRIVTYNGVVFSARAQKTISVQVDRYAYVSKYKKWYRHTKKFKVHDEYEEANEGDIVQIRQYRPISKTKSHVLDRILMRRPVLEHDVVDPNAERRANIKKTQLEGAPQDIIQYP